MTVCERDRDRMVISTPVLQNGDEAEIEHCPKCGEFNVIINGNEASYVPQAHGQKGRLINRAESGGEGGR